MARQAGRAYQDFKRLVRFNHAAEQRPCEMERCLFPERTIDYRRSYPDPQCWSLDHRRALHQGGAELDAGNARASHLRCNLSAGGKAGNAARRRRGGRSKVGGRAGLDTPPLSRPLPEGLVSRPDPPPPPGW